jgi:hypothetical protein
MAEPGGVTPPFWAIISSRMSIPLLHDVRSDDPGALVDRRRATAEAN